MVNTNDYYTWCEQPIKYIYNIIILLYTNIPFINIADREDKTSLKRKPKRVWKLKKNVFEMRLYILDIRVSTHDHGTQCIYIKCYNYILSNKKENNNYQRNTYDRS